MNERETLKLALEALEAWETGCGTTEYLALVEKAVTAIKETLAQPEQEPVAWMCSDADLLSRGYKRFSERREGAWSIPVYTTPPQRKPLTGKECDRLIEKYAGASLGDWSEEDYDSVVSFIRQVEAAQGIKE